MDTQTIINPEARATIRSESVTQQPATLGEAIRLRAAEQPDHPAVIATGFAPLTYGELHDLIHNARNALRGAGFDRNARIAIAMPSGPQAALATAAVSCSAVAIPLNPKQTAREIASSFSSLKPKAVLIAADDQSDTRKAAEDAGVAVIEAVPAQAGTLGFVITARGDTKPNEPDEPDPAAPAFILQTSGTAAEPKLIPFSHRNMLAAAARLRHWFHLTPDDRCLSASPPFYSHGLKVTVFTPLLTGGSVAFPSDSSKFEFSEWFRDLRPTWYSAGPTLHRLVLDHCQGRTDAKAGHALRFALSGGAPLPRNVLEGLQEALGTPVVEHLGSSEAAQIAANLPPPGPSKIGTCGIPWPGTVSIVGEDGLPLPPGQQGEILVGGPTLISGYLNAPELNRASFVDGWFKTGDLGSIDEDGFLTVHGRITDVINRGGEKISPLELDDALMRHPAVAEAAAFGIPHPRLGEDVAAAVVLRPGITATPVELRRFLQDQVASFKVPRKIVIQDHLPKGKTGKVLRRQLRDVLENTGAAQAASTKGVAPEQAPNSQTRTLIVQLTELWERLLKVSPISIDDDFSERGGDSLLAMEMLSEVEQLAGQAIPSSILFEARTIRELAGLLAGQNIQPKPVMKMNPDGVLRPLFLFHGDYNGGGLYAARLAKLLGDDQPLFVVAPHDLGKDPVPLSVQAIAADRLPLVLQAQPKGPYRLSGYCLGGLVAFEIARHLIAKGEKVEMVGMIDAPTVNARPSLKLLLAAMRPARKIDRAFTNRVMKRVCYIFSQVDRPMRSLRSWSKSVFKWIHDERDANMFAMLDYSPKPVPVPVVFFEADYGPASWRRMSTKIETVALEGNHAEAVRAAENLTRIARHLRAPRRVDS